MPDQEVVVTLRMVDSAGALDRIRNFALEWAKYHPNRIAEGDTRMGSHGKEILDFKDLLIVLAAASGEIAPNARAGRRLYVELAEQAVAGYQKAVENQKTIIARQARSLMYIRSVLSSSSCKPEEKLLDIEEEIEHGISRSTPVGGLPLRGGGEHQASVEGDKAAGPGNPV